jgi:hypothetical protein
MMYTLTKFCRLCLTFKSADCKENVYYQISINTTESIKPRCVIVKRNATVDMIVEEIKRQYQVQFQNIDNTAIYVFRGKDGEKLQCDTRVN